MLGNLLNENKSKRRAAKTRVPGAGRVLGAAKIRAHEAALN